jgi:hypothetical protein
MGFQLDQTRTWALGVLIVTAVSCSVPFFARTGAGSAGIPTDKAEKVKPSRLSGVITLLDDCAPGYYQVRLQGLFESTQIQVDSQSDQSGRFNIVVPPGEYTMTVNKGECGAKERITLEENTEHMVAVQVQDSKRIEKVGRLKGRLPASVLVPVR